MRFPGFEGEWKTKKLREITDKINSGKTPLGGEAVYTTNGVLFIRSQNVNNDRLELDNSVFIPESINNQMKNSIVRPNDILLNITGASLGRSCVVPENFKEGNVNQHVCIIRLKQNYNPRFIQPIFSSSKGQSIFNSLQTGSGREGLNFESIKGIKLLIPQKSEQQKIAFFLSLIDERILTQNKIIEELETLKTSISKKIFSRELRFKNNNGGKFPEWINKRFREIATIIMGQSPESTSYNIEGIGLPLIQGNADIVNRLSAPRQYTKNPTKQCDIGDILLTVRAPVGYVSKSSHNACIGRGICSVKNNKHSSNEFIYQFLLYFENKWKSLEQGSTFTSVNSSDIGSIIIKVPCIEEQKKIADFLHGIDSKISTEKILLQKLEEQKKYLLDNLFV